jgi:hypothetical protein
MPQVTAVDDQFGTHRDRGGQRSGGCGHGGLVGEDADGVYPRYRAGQGQLPGGSTLVEPPLPPLSDPAVSIEGALGHLTPDTSHPTGCKKVPFHQ